MSISRFFSVGALGASLLVLAACGSPAGPEATAPEPRANEPTTGPDRVETGTATTATNAGVPAYSPEVDTGVYSNFRSYGFFNNKGGETEIIGLGDGTGDNEFTSLTQVKLMSTSGEAAGGYIPFYLSWSFADAPATDTNAGQAEPIFFAPGVGAAGARYGKDVEGEEVQAAPYDSPYNYLRAGLADNPVNRVDEVSTNSNEQDQAPQSGFTNARSKRNTAYSLARSGGEYLTARVTRGTSTIAWTPGSGAADAEARDATIARYDVELIYPQLSATGWKLQYSTFILSRARRISGLVDGTGNTPSVPATYGDYITAHSFTTTTPGTLNKDDLVPDGQEVGEARYKTTFAAWGHKKDDPTTGPRSILYFLTGQGTLTATFSKEGGSDISGSFDTWLRKVTGGPRTGTAETREIWRSVRFEAKGTSGSNTFNPEFNGKATVADGTDGQAFSDVAYDETEDNLEGTFAGPRAEEVVGTFTLTPTDPDSGPAFLGAFAGNRPANPAP